MNAVVKRFRKRFRKKAREASNRVTFAALRLLGAAVLSLDAENARRAATLFGDLMHRVLGIRRSLVYANLRSVFPEKTEPEIRRIAAAVYRNLMTTLVEVLRFPLIRTREDVAALVDIDDREFLSRLRSSGKGIVVVSAHYGNWELMATAFGLMVTPVTIIVKRLRNRLVDRWMNDWRTMRGNRIVYKRQAVREGLRLLESGGVLTLLGDQSDPKANNYGEFLGRKATMFHGAAFFALKAGVPLFVGMCRRNADGRRYTIEMQEVDTSGLAFCKADIEKLAERYTRVIEGYIRRNPEEWLWLHDRWKRLDA